MNDRDRVIRALNRQSSEKEFMVAVIDYAEAHRWLCYHTHDSRRSQAGFPDLVLVRDGTLCFWELKSEAGVLSRTQERWLTELGNSRELDVRLVRPRDWDALRVILA